MTWREDLRRVTVDSRIVDGRAVGGRQLIGASFRGAPFFVDVAERGGGRRTVVHEFPLRDDPFVEDLGRRARTFRVDGYVVGDDYLAQRDALLAALEDEAGAGALVHPYYGDKRVICMSVSVRESRAEGGMATFAIEFAETPNQAPVPAEVVDAAEQVAATADNANAAVDAELVERYDTQNLPAFALESAQEALIKASVALDEKLAPVVSATQELAELTSQLFQVTSTAAALVRAPADAIGDFRAAIAGLVETAAASPRAVMDALIDAYLVDLGVLVQATTATRARARENQVALIGALRRVMAIGAARLAPRVAYESIDEALAARDQVAELLEEQAAEAGDTAYPALVDLRSQVLRAVPGDRTFASVVTVTRRVPVPSLLLAYQLHGHVDLEADILARNGIRHPGFVAGDIKALSDG